MGTLTLTTGGILTRTTALIATNPQFSATAMVILTVIGVASDTLPEVAGVLLSFVSIFASIYFQTYATKSALQSRSLSAPAGAAVGGLVSVFLVTIVTGLGILAGYLLLIIPGIIITARWLIAVPIVVTTQDGVIAAITKSWHLTRAHMVPIATAVIVVYLPLLAAIAVTISAELDGAAWGDENALSFAVQTAIAVSTVASWYLAVAVFEQVRGNADSLSEIFA